MRDLLDWIERTGLANIAWMTDLDDTVIDHDRSNGAVFVPPGLAESCRRLDEQTAGFYIVTGRNLLSVDTAIFPADRFRISAEYHNVTRFDATGPPRRVRPMPPWEVIDGRLGFINDAHPKIFLKAMEYLRAVQYFRVPENEKDAVRTSLRGPLAALVDELNAQPGCPPMELMDFDDAFDIIPAGTSKGPAIGDILADVQNRTGREAVPLYFGDNAGDIPAGREAQAHGGVFVAVGDDPGVIAAADFHLPDTAAARALFAKAAAIGNAPSLPPPRPQP
jgi:trehalose-6-phosphatase